MRYKLSVLLAFVFFCAAVLLLGCGTAHAAAPTLTLDCTSAVLIDGNNGDQLFAQNADARCFPASVTKIMTLVLALEAVDSGRISLDDRVTVSAAAADMGGSQVYLYSGEVRTVNELLIAIAVGSGNDAAYAMAEYVGGSCDSFIEMMNAKAAELGMSGTHFSNPHGLHAENHYTTAADLGRLAYHALSVPLFLDYTSIYEYEFRSDPQLVLWNTNRLLKWYAGTDGMKTGYTSEAGRNLVATVKRDGLRLISVVLGCEAAKSHFSRSMELLNFGFNSYKQVNVRQQGEAVSAVPVEKGAAARVSAITAESIGYAALKNADDTIDEVIELPPQLTAPVVAGSVIGTLTVFRNGERWKSIDLLASESIGRSGWGRSREKLLDLIW